MAGTHPGLERFVSRTNQEWLSGKLLPFIVPGDRRCVATLDSDHALLWREPNWRTQ